MAPRETEIYIKVHPIPFYKYNKVLPKMTNFKYYSYQWKSLWWLTVLNIRILKNHNHTEIVIVYGNIDCCSIFWYLNSFCRLVIHKSSRLKITILCSNIHIPASFILQLPNRFRIKPMFLIVFFFLVWNLQYRNFLNQSLRRRPK